MVRYEGTYSDFTENFRFFCFIANCIKNYKQILCIFTTSILVYMVTVLQELPDKNRALKEMKRVLKPGRILAVTEFYLTQITL